MSKIKTVANTSNPAPKKGRRKAAPSKASTRAKAPTNTPTMKLIGQATKALARANKFLSKIKA